MSKSMKVVGLLIRARKRGYLEFRGEMLYQGQDDEEPILLYAKPYDLVNEVGVLEERCGWNLWEVVSGRWVRLM